MVFLLPATPAHAVGGVTLSTITSGVQTAATSGTVASTLVITGTGFLGANPIAITTLVGSTTVAWLTAAACASPFATFTNSGTGSANSLIKGGCLTTTASGTFQVSATVPALPGGAETIVVSDGTTSVSTSYTITPKVSVTFTGNNFGFPEQSITPSIALSGFGAAESVSVTTTMWTSASSACTTTAFGSCTTGSATTVADTTGGAKTITATGATSGLSATTTYTVNPWAAFYNSATGKSAFSFVGSAPTSLLIEAHGLAAGTVAANSVTIGGIATSHASVVVASSGSFGGAGAQLVVAPTSQVPFGLASVVVGGTTFSFAAGNIALGAGTWGGAMISSIVGTAAVSTGVMATSAGSYKPGAVTTASTTSPAPAANTVAFIGYGFVPGGGAVAIAAGGASLGAVTFNLAGGTSCTSTCDINGAVFATSTLSDTAWSLTGTPTAATTYTTTTTQASGGPANVLSPSFGITPWIDTTKGGIFQGASTSTTVDYAVSNLQVKVHGFGATDTVTVTIGTATMVSGGTIAATNGGGTTAAGQVPDIAGGVQNVVATGSVTGQTVTATGAVTYDPRIDSTGAGALTINAGGAGQTTNLRTGTTYGVHGLAANTAYNIMWNAISGGINVGSFTSTAIGGIPVPGKQFSIPGDSSGIHILDLQAASGTTSAIYGNVKADFVPTEAPFSSAYTTQFGDLLFSNIALLTASPSVGVIGSPMTLSGSGLAPGGSYVVALSSTAGSVSATAPALQVFTATSTGGIPSGITVTLTETPTVLETGTIQYFQIQTTTHFGTTTVPDATAQFVLAASATLNGTSAAAGHAVTLSAHALNTAAVYSVIFNYIQSPSSPTVYTGTPVGIIAPNSVGAGSTSFNVPSSATNGAYIVQLVTNGGGGAALGSAVLDIPLSITVGAAAGNCASQGTTCMAVSGTPSVQQVGGNKAIVASFTNNSNAPQTAIIYAVVHNAAGQTVYYTTATVSPAAGASSTAQLILFGLPSGTYSATLFATSTGGTAISGTTTVSVTL